VQEYVNHIQADQPAEAGVPTTAMEQTS
jgi:hypothetical protein